MLAKNLFSHLPVRLRQTMEMHYIEEKSYKEIASSENIPVSTIKMRVFHAKQKLRAVGKYKKTHEYAPLGIQNENIDILEAPSHVITILRRERKIYKVRDLLALRQDDLVMTRGLDWQAVCCIEDALRKLRLKLCD